MQILQSRARGWMRHTWDAVVGSDPGLTRLRQALFAALAMAGALAVELALCLLTHANQMSTVVAMLLGAMVAMIGSNALGGTGGWSKVRTAAFFPVAMGLGIGLGVAVGTHIDVMLMTFVAVMFVAVYVRRFGMDFFFYGFMLWMGYFFSSFLHATVSTVPHLMLAIVLGTAWVLLLSVTVTRTNPKRTLRRVRSSFNARARRLARASAYLVMADPDDATEVARRRRKVGAQRGRLAEAALMIDGWSADSDALPQGWSASAVRRRLVDLQLCLGQLTTASQDLVGADRELRRAAVQALWALTLGHNADAATAAAHLRGLAESDRLGTADERRSARHLAVGVLDYVELEPDIGEPPGVTGLDDDQFTPAVALAFGYLPGSPAVVRDVDARGRRWNPLSRLDFTTRQAVQVAVAGALAIVFGRMLDPHRYYWAVIAALVAFAGTGTRSETALKATNRVIGTLVGLFAGILLAHLTTGHTVWTLAVIVVSMSCGFYLVRISYAYMIFFVTIMVAQLYSVLHEFSDDLLFLRLKETALGGLIGIVVGLVVTPVSTRDAVESVRRNLLLSLRDFLLAIRGHLQPNEPTDPPDLDGPLRDLDTRLRALLQVGAPLTRPLLAANSPRWARHNLTLYADTVRRAQALTRSVRAEAGTDEHLAAAVTALARTTAALAAISSPLGAAPPPGPGHLDLEAADREIGAARANAGHLRAVRQDLVRLHAALRQMIGPFDNTDVSTRDENDEPDLSRSAQSR
ncbi:FUSC family protein [Leekyejoonella antrihumi]|uniref:FUSC family protein n=1 Tax=Leekyejoonella antrihumi TaxID=1660198 RepID=A0A563EA09_9MICO|nr:FUSC family protein [Leekyejoonella antrihumi]TWP39041.1 FUSC family protein [Leekyejoonella antrihumi]